MVETAHGESNRFVLPRGATGFHRPADGPLPATDLRVFRTALHTAARLGGGALTDVEEQAYPRTFHTATLAGRAGESVVLCHAHHPWIAFARTRRDWYADEFLPPPPWAHVFTDSSLTVLGGDLLAGPLSYADTSVLGPDEWRHVRYHGVSTLGGVLFNAWD
ncbi:MULTISPECIES: hypothetical protein [unclassified Streptomyces]|uniref:hypothetical protein n=1 Tax=unclassified Streptomyces TaxID=2593676 RepID=UPI003828C03A